MLLEDYIYKNGKETTAQELGLMARQLMEVVMKVGRNINGCTVQKAEFIITEKTVGWKVELMVPGEKMLKTEEEKRKLYEGIARELGF